jgi:uncharacterized protein
MMRSKVIGDADVVTYVVVRDPGDEAVAALEQFARAESVWKPRRSLPSAAFERATVGWFDHMAKDSRRIPVEEQCEVLSLIGDVAEDPDGPSLNVHVVLGLSDGTTRGGHLIEGRVFPTLEGVVTENPAERRKVMHPELGIALIDLDRQATRPLAVRGVACPAAGNPRGGDRADQGQERSCLRSE